MISKKEPGVRRWQIVVVLFLVSNGLLAGGTGAAERTRPFRIGALTISWGPTPATVGLRDGLVALGYREDQDFFLGVRFTQGDASALPAAARDLVQQGVDLIFTDGDNATQAAQRATDRIPIVFAGPVDALGLGLVESFARPGGNVTGVTDLRHELGSKRLELFRQMIPNLKRVLLPYNANEAYSVAMMRVYRDAAPHLGIGGIEFVERAVRTEQEAQTALSQVHQGDVDGILASPTISLNLAGFIAETASQQAIPVMYATSFLAKRGGLASYGPDYYATGRQAARLVDKILKGANPAEIPVEVNSHIEFVINLKTAKALGLTIPPEVLFQADRVVR